MSQQVVVRMHPLDEMEQLRRERDALKAEVSELKTKIEVGEQLRSSVSDMFDGRNTAGITPPLVSRDSRRNVVAVPFSPFSPLSPTPTITRNPSIRFTAVPPPSMPPSAIRTIRNPRWTTRV